MSYYSAGDYYTAGDPGFFDFIGGIAKKVLPIAAPIIGTAVGGPFGGLIGGLAGGLGGGVGATSPGIGTTALALSGGGIGKALGGGAASGLASAAAGALAKQVFAKKVGPIVDTTGSGKLVPLSKKAGRKFHALMGVKRHRRMNVLNPRALRRALRRAVGFEHFARSVLTITHPHHGRKFKMPRRRKRR